MTKLALKNPYLVIVVALAALVLGIVSYQKLPADLLPIFTTPAVQIVTFYPGMPPEVMERDIMSRLERWTGQSVGIEHQEGKAMLGVSVVKDFFNEGISLATAMSQVTSYAMSDMFYLPPGTIPPMVMPFDPTASVPLCLVSVSSPTMSEEALYDVAYFELRNRLQSIQGVIAPAVYGGKLRRILAYVDREKLEVRNLSPMDVVRALKQQNVFIPAGNLKSGDIDFQIFANAMPQHVDQLNDIPVAMRDSGPVLLRDVGRVKDSSQIQTNVVRINGRRQVYIPIYRQPGANTIQIVDAIRSRLERILQRLREMDPRAGDLALEVVLDQSVYVRKSIRGLQIAAGLGALLAAAVVFLFLRNLRSTLIISLAIPLSILVALVGLFYSGETLNAMTLGGLALAVGILVDQSIVELENIARHARMGKSPVNAAIEGTQEVSLPILVSTITFIVVFYPIVYLSGMARFLFTPLALSATLAIIASYFISITLIPAYCGHFPGALGGHRHAVGGSEGDGNAGCGSMERFAARYAGLVDRALTARWKVLGGAALLLLAAGLLLALCGQELFPQVDSGQLQIYVRLASGTRIEKTEVTVSAIERAIIEEVGEPDPEYPRIERHPGSNLKILISNIGVLMDWPAAYTPNTGPMDAFILVQFKDRWDSPGASAIAERLRERLMREFPGTEFAFDTGGLLTAAVNLGEPAPIHLQIQGSSLETSHLIATRMVEEIAGVQGVVDVRIAQRLDYPIIDVQIDRIKAAYAGVNVEDIMKNLVTATNSSVNFDPAFWIDERNGNHYFIGAQYPEADLTSLDAILNVPVTGARSRVPVPLGTLVHVSRKQGPAVINHRNITRVIDVYAGVALGNDVGSVVRRIERRLGASDEIAPVRKRSERGIYYEVGGTEFANKGYSYTLAGEVQIMRDSFRQLAFGLVLAVILVYLVMVALLRSFLDPFIILLTVPLGFIGVGFLLFSTSTTINIQSLMGMVMMVGIVVEYSIVLVEFANRRLGEGLDPRGAILEAARIRLRPILMTSLTSLFAVLPMAFGVGGGDANVPLARAIVGGVLGATVLTLFVVPCLYVSFKRRLPDAARTAMGVS